MSWTGHALGWPWAGVSIVCGGHSMVYLELGWPSAGQAMGFVGHGLDLQWTGLAMG
jgi:hypothetical protein